MRTAKSWKNSRWSYDWISEMPPHSSTAWGRLTLLLVKSAESQCASSPSHRLQRTAAHSLSKSSSPWKLGDYCVNLINLCRPPFIVVFPFSCKHALSLYQKRSILLVYGFEGVPRWVFAAHGPWNISYPWISVRALVEHGKWWSW